MVNKIYVKQIRSPIRRPDVQRKILKGLGLNKMNKISGNLENLCAASDAFFPFVDGVEKLVQSGVKAFIQPSGSIRDKEIIKFANQTNTILVFSNTRHFKH